MALLEYLLFLPYGLAWLVGALVRGAGRLGLLMAAAAAEGYSIGRGK